MTKLERSHFLSWHDGKSKRDSSKSSRRDNWPKVNRLLRRRCEFTAEGADISLRRRPSKLPHQRVERKAPWEPRRVEGDGHVIATWGFTRPRSFTEDNAFHHVPGASYGRGKGVGRGLGGGFNLGVGVGRGVAVGVVLAVAVGVAVAVAVGVDVAVAVAVAVAVGVGVGEPLPEGPSIASVVGDPVLK